MANFDVFNGDADGIISLVQLRLAEPLDATLVTGRKRDIKLLDRVDASEGDRVTVLDISMRTNTDELRRILSAGAKVFYVDHHNAGEVPDSPNLSAIIDTSPEICTAMLVDDVLDGQFRAWAITAAYGDNFSKLAETKALGMDLPLEKLERLGMLINYNGYGGSIEDLHLHPVDLYQELLKFKTPMEFLAADTSIFETLSAGYERDFSQAELARKIDETPHGLIVRLGNNAGSRRVSGVFGNQLAQENPERAHAILTEQADGYLVSIRAPISRRTGADKLALKFETGGGRSAAAGINHLPESRLRDFVKAFREEF